MRNNQTPQSLKLLTDNFLDYAGMFPPASLSLDQAFLNYNDYIESEYNWMLSKFVISAKKIPELISLIEDKKIQLKNKIPLTILGGSDVVAIRFLDSLNDDIKKICDLITKFENCFTIDSYEAHFPLELLVVPDTQSLINFFKQVSEAFTGNLKKNVNIFYEVQPNKDLPALAKAASYYNTLGSFIGCKLRTGGVEASSFPSAEKIAYALKACAENAAPLKCTAGLHHPFRHFDQSVKTKMHGFINIFCAAIFAYILDLNEHNLTLMILDETNENFVFTDSSIKWLNFEVYNEEISYAREKFITSFGSCSFEEPLQDLKSLDLL